MTARPNTLCRTEATTGAPDCGDVRPRACGRTRSRPRAKPYRALVLWNEIMAASTDVMNSACPMSTQVLPSAEPARTKIVSDSYCCEKATTWSGPVATDMAHDANRYTAPTIAMEANVAIGTVRRGLRDSSEYTTDASKPTKPRTARARIAPAPVSNRLPTASVSKVTSPSAGLPRLATEYTRMIAISLSNKTANTLPLTSTRSTPKTATMAQAPSAMIHQSMEMPNHWSSCGAAATPIMPYSPTCSRLYAIRAM